MTLVVGGGPTCPTMAAMQSHLPYVTDYSNVARRQAHIDIMIRPPVTDISILAFGRYAEMVRAGHEAGLRAVRAWKVANPEMLPMLDDGLWPGPRGGFSRRQGLPSTDALPQMASMGGPGGGDGGDSVDRSGNSVDRAGGFGFGGGYGRAPGGGMTEDDWGDDVSYSRRSSADGYSDWSRVPASAAAAAAAATAGQRAAEAAAHAGAAGKQQQHPRQHPRQRQHSVPVHHQHPQHQHQRQRYQHQQQQYSGGEMFPPDWDDAGADSTDAGTDTGPEDMSSAGNSVRQGLTVRS